METKLNSGCGKEYQEAAQRNPRLVSLKATKRKKMYDEIPDGIKGWSWGAFIFGGFWAIGNRTWIGLLSFVPVAGGIMNVILALKGREWAWKNKKWKNVEHFNQVQKKWSLCGGLLLFLVLVSHILLTIPAYQDYVQNAKQQHELSQSHDSETLY